MAMLQAPAPLERSIFHTPSVHTVCDTWATLINRDTPSFDIRPQIPQVIAQAVAIPVT